MKTKQLAALIAATIYLSFGSGVVSGNATQDESTNKSLVVNHFVLVRKESIEAGPGKAIFAVTEFEIDYQNNKLTRFSSTSNDLDQLVASTVFEFDRAARHRRQR